MASFLIDTAGTVDVKSIRILEASDPAFATAVCASLPRARFRDYLGAPPTSPVRMTSPFLFDIAASRGRAA
jgi:hypothetical protein